MNQNPDSERANPHPPAGFVHDFDCAHDPCKCDVVRPIATRYELLPRSVFTGNARDHHPNPRPITVEWRGGDQWAVVQGREVWCEATDEWEWEPSPSNRDQAFLDRTRYLRWYALAIAERLAAAQIDGSGSEVTRG